jgi:hypothetical protein
MESIFPFGWALTAVLGRIFEVFINPIFWLVVVLVGFQYRRIAAMRNAFLGSGSSSVIVETLQAVGFGLLGGFIGSYLIVFTGLTFPGTANAIIYLLVTAVILMLINPRFLCFAYAGGLLATLHLLTGFPEISVPQLMALVAILHFVESVLIVASGHLNAVPAYIRLPRGQIVGGFALQKFWPLPLVILVVESGFVPGAMEMPEWWPLIKPELGIELALMLFVLYPVVAGLGYGDMATTRTPREKTWASAVNLAGYSLVLYLLAYLAAFQPVFAWAAALFSPLGHELIVFLSRNAELNGKPIYIPRSDGLLVLDVREHSPAWTAGLRSGDLIREVNGLPVRLKGDLYALVAREGVQEVGFVKDGRHYSRDLVSVPPGGTLGVIPVPEGGEVHYLEMKPAWIARWLRGVVDKKTVS